MVEEIAAACRHMRVPIAGGGAYLRNYQQDTPTSSMPSPRSSSVYT